MSQQKLKTESLLVRGDNKVIYLYEFFNGLNSTYNAGKVFNFRKPCQVQKFQISKVHMILLRDICRIKRFVYIKTTIGVSMLIMAMQKLKHYSNRLSSYVMKNYI